MSRHGSIGIDVGGTKTLLVLADEQLETLENIRFKTEPHLGLKRFARKAWK